MIFCLRICEEGSTWEVGDLRAEKLAGFECFNELGEISRGSSGSHRCSFNLA
jgi:hypothetical protein